MNLRQPNKEIHYENSYQGTQTALTIMRYVYSGYR
jgi:hypothetical protein